MRRASRGAALRRLAHPSRDAGPDRAWRDRKVPGYWRTVGAATLLDGEAARVRFVDETMRRYVATHPGDDHAAKSYPYDVLRLAKTLEWLAELRPSGLRILELGWYGVASFVLEQAFPDNDYVRDPADLRQPLPYPDQRFDLVLGMEVIEHVADLEYAHATTLSGVRHSLREVRRVLRVDGSTLLTTPNACSLLVLERALRLEPPWQYPFHFRELTPHELQILVEQAGLHVRRFRTEYVWSRPEQMAALRSFLRDNELDEELRGDDMFLLAQRTDTWPEPRGALDLPI
jgi:SAM-dependent methyltransferase